MKTKLRKQRYTDQLRIWPTWGKHILAQFDEEGVVVYQAYRPGIGRFAAEHGYFGGDFSLSRMSWIKTNFLWMMYRSGWGTKEDQEVTLAVRLKRAFFDSLLEQAVPSSHDSELYPDAAAWQKAVAASNVRLQWDPDHDPSGKAVQRRAVQLGLRGPVLREYARDAILQIDDISDLVAAQREIAASGKMDALVTPLERVYTPAEALAQRLKLSPYQPAPAAP